MAEILVMLVAEDGVGKPPTMSDHLGREIVGYRERERERGRRERKLGENERGIFATWEGFWLILIGKILGGHL